MTTILCDLTQQLIAVDSYEEHGSDFYIRTCIKYFHITGSVRGIAAFCGETQAGVRWVEWLRTGAGDETRPSLVSDSFQGLFLDQYGALNTYGGLCVPCRIDEPYYAIGSGNVWAMAAMHCGASVPEAMRLAARWNPHTAFPVYICDAETVREILEA